MNIFSVFPEKVTVRRSVVPFLTIAAFLVALLALVLLYHDRQDAELDLRIIRNGQADHILTGKKVILLEMKRLQSDLIVAANLPDLRHYINTPGHPESRTRVAGTFVTFLRAKPYYFQLRFLDPKGREVVRAERQGERLIITPDDQLQDKSERYYTRAMADLGEEDIYISPMDLNMEHKRISTPLTPTLRLGKAVFDDQGRKAGFVVLNYRGSELLEFYRMILHNREDKALHLVSSRAFLVDRHGRYLPAGDPKDESRLFFNRGRTFSRSFPDIWQQIQKEERGQWLDSRGLMTGLRIRLQRNGRPRNSAAPSAGNPAAADGAYWYLFSHVDPEELADLVSPGRHFHWNIFLILLPVFLFVSLLMALVFETSRSNRRQLLKQRNNFHLLYDQAPLPYQSLDSKGRLLEANRTWVELLGYGKDEIRGRAFSELIASEDKKEFESSFHRLLKKGKPIRDFRLRLIRKNGSPLPVALYCQLRLDPDDSRIRTHGMFIDISELREKEEQISHLNLILATMVRIHRALAQGNDLQELLNKCCTILTESRGYQSAWVTLPPEESRPAILASSGLLHDFNGLIRRINTETMPPCILEVKRQQKAVVIASPDEFCHRCPMADGYPSAGVMCAPLRHGGHCFGYLTVSLPPELMRNEEELQRFAELAEDIGLALFSGRQQQQRELVEKELHRTLEALEEAQQIARIGSYERNWQTGEGVWSDSTYRIFGYEPGELECSHENFLDLVVPEDRERLFSLLERSKDTRTPFSADFRICRGDGAVRVIHGTGRTIFDHTGSPLLIRGLFQDVTEQKNMEAQLLQTEKLTTIAGLAAGVSHELNTPLSAILQSIQVIEMALAPDREDNRKAATAAGIDLDKMHCYFQDKQIDFFFRGIRESAVRASAIIRDLLDFSRPRKAIQKPVDINALADSSLELARADYEMKKEYDIINLEVIKEYEPHLPFVDCVAMDIEQVLLNLIKNAVQAMSETGGQSRLLLRTKKDGNTVRIEVEDNGPGVAENIRPHIFDPFFTTREVGKGTGLGLSIAYGIIHDRHGGDIRVKSRPGRKTTFIIELPLDGRRSHEKRMEDLSRQAGRSITG